VARDEVADQHKSAYGKYPVEEQLREHRRLLNDLARKFRSDTVQAFGESGITDYTGLIDLLFRLVCKKNIVFRLDDLHLPDITSLGHSHKGSVIGILDLHITDEGHKHHIYHHHDRKRDEIKHQHRFLWLFYFVHLCLLWHYS